MDNRIGIIGIVVEDLEKTASVNEILHESSELFLGRMGLPIKEKGLSVITLICQGSNDEISSVTGRIGRIGGVQVKSMLTKNG
jgi:putative iron-only hydrogenase system regulator